MKKVFILLAFSAIAIHSGAQRKSEWKNLKETEQIVKFLASDDLAGRFPFTPGIDKAAAFIADEFKKAGLKPWDGKSFIQSFNLTQLHFVSANAVLNGEPVDEKNIFASTAGDKVLLQINEGSADYETAYISKTDTFISRFVALRRIQKKNLVIFADTSHRRIFSAYHSASQKYYSSFQGYNTSYSNDLVVILTDKKPENWSVEYRQRAEYKELKNVIGLLPGKKLSQERVVFSAHYDHLGIRKPNSEKDSIYNGANDDASGVAAIIQLAHYFSKKGNNERALVFSAFTFEEGGGFGAKYFTEHNDPSSIIADFNIEMIGSVSEKGVGAADITGYEHSDFGKSSKKTLKGHPINFILTHQRDFMRPIILHLPEKEFRHILFQQQEVPANHIIILLMMSGINWIIKT
ncbi:MAG TPA: M28 family peptidase [Chitinophagaceae bacterium]|nr:M28 family peptidase [Chitinophagaceae bacterium]